ncbi:MAG: glycoside hydrolase family 36 N-terminal domain-containing protein, partial [Pseudomonadota bacterium]
MIQTWRLDSARQTLALGSVAGRMPEVIYWGAPLPAEEDLTAVVAATRLDVTGGMLDENPDLSICPEAARSFHGQPGLIVRDTDGTPLLPQFTLTQAEEAPQALTLTCTDTPNRLTYMATFEIDPVTHVIAMAAKLTSDRPLHLHWFAAPVLPAPQSSDEMIDFA